MNKKILSLTILLLIGTTAFAGYDSNPRALEDECPCLGDIVEPMIPDYRVDTSDMAELLTAMIVYGNHSDSYNITGAPNQEHLLTCGDITDTANTGAPDGRVDTGDMAALLTHLILYGDPNDSYNAPCIGTVSGSQFHATLEILVNGAPWAGETVVPGDIVTVTFVDTGDNEEAGPFAEFSLSVCGVQYVPDSWYYNLPPGLLGGNIQLDTGQCLEVGGTALTSPSSPMPAGRELFTFQFSIPHAMQGSQIDLTLSGSYGGTDANSLDTTIEVACVCSGDIGDTTSLGPPDGKVDTGDMAVLLTALILYGDPADDYNVVGAPNQSFLLNCIDLLDTTTLGPPDDKIDTGDMAALLTHLILNGNPAANYEAPCM